MQNASKSISADVAEWQTQATQNRSGNHVGSSPTIGTKQAVRTFSGSGLLYFCCKSYLCVLRENADDGIGRGDLAGKIQMGIDIAGGADIAVPQPLLNLFQAHAVGVKQACAAMPLRYNYDKPEKPRISRAFGYLARFFILFQTEKSSREVVIS